MSLDASGAWREALAKTPACLSPEEFDAGLSEAQRAHLGECARCQAEKSLWESFALGKPDSSEALPVQWITAETKRRLATRGRSNWWARLFETRLGNPWVAGPVTACLVAAIGFFAARPTAIPQAGASDGGEIVYRTGTVELAEPIGDISASPSFLRWHPVTGASSYEVQILEVDRDVLWKSESARNQIDLPASVRSRLVAGKTVLWQVIAKDAKGNPVASSPSERFRVKPKNVPTGE